MKFNWVLFLGYLFVWIVVGMMVVENMVPMIVFIICSGVGGGVILAFEKRKSCE